MTTRHWRIDMQRDAVERLDDLLKAAGADG
jgi:hypothetical protein